LKKDKMGIKGSNGVKGVKGDNGIKIREVLKGNKGKIMG